MIRNKVAYEALCTRSNTFPKSNRQIKIWDCHNGINQARFKEITNGVGQGSELLVFSRATMFKSKD